jgi:hypothetical protein
MPKLYQIGGFPRTDLPWTFLSYNERETYSRMLQYERDILGWVRDATWVERVRGIPPRVINEGRTYVMRADNGTKMIVLRGVTRMMEDYLMGASLGPREARDPVQRHAEQLARAEKQRRRAPATLQSKLWGFAKGARIHRQIEDYTLLDEGSFLRKYPDACAAPRLSS